MKLYQIISLVLSILCLVYPLLGYVPDDNYLINCGSLNDTTIGDRIFMADTANNFNSSVLSTPETIRVSANSSSVSSTYGSILYQTARILKGPSNYKFPIKKNGWHFLRFHFSPFHHDVYNLRSAIFSVSAQNYTLLKNFQPGNSVEVKEYSLNVTSNSLVLDFTPSASSFAFLNALEVFSIPDELFPSTIKMIDEQGELETLESRALETVMRINMGNVSVSPHDDTLWRSWVPDLSYMASANLVQLLRNNAVVNYTEGASTEYIAPLSVYGTASRLHPSGDGESLVNATWSFDVDPGFSYFVRFHFCDISPPDPNIMIFSVFLNSKYADRTVNLSIAGAPIYRDVGTTINTDPKINISIGRTGVLSTVPDGLLNGVEIMKISNLDRSLDTADSRIQALRTSSKVKPWIIVISSVGAIVVALILGFLIVFVFRRNKKANMVHTTQEHFTTYGKDNSLETSMFSRSKMSYRFPFAEIKEATDDFSESLIIGIGGFGKVYKGVLRDGTEVAVKRGSSQLDQGIEEFRTEIEMLSKFRHRHLVSFIGYCDENNETIIIYEYMENGTLKNHLYGSNLPKLSWKQRLEICIGSARGLHYLHTGSDKAIIHRDVKSANILLDSLFLAKVADFGLSKTGPDMDKTHVSTAVKGSFGYLDPEYLIRQQLTEKSDVYSFGVVMFEILCGRAVIDPSLPREMVNLVECVLKSSKKGELEKIVDPHLLEDIKHESLVKFAETAEKCLAESGVDRPTMGDVLWNLEYALQQYINDKRPPSNNDVENNPTFTSLSTTEFSMGSVDDLAGVSMSKVFSEMVRSEIA
ncbi:hypothetical protein Leryth_027360 [Lithospermum erythrorhizon]|nr:hypothetical protein Leryth_027360 [Lithospermum erythrorhizon]